MNDDQDNTGQPEGGSSAERPPDGGSPPREQQEQAEPDPVLAPDGSTVVNKELIDDLTDDGLDDQVRP